MKTTLDNYCTVSGQLINFHKLLSNSQIKSKFQKSMKFKYLYKWKLTSNYRSLQGTNITSLLLLFVGIIIDLVIILDYFCWTFLRLHYQLDFSTQWTFVAYIIVLDWASLAQYVLFRMKSYSFLPINTTKSTLFWRYSALLASFWSYQLNYVTSSFFLRFFGSDLEENQLFPF